MPFFASGFLKLKPFFLFLEYRIAFVNRCTVYSFFFHIYSKAQIHHNDLREWVTPHFFIFLSVSHRCIAHVHYQIYSF